MREDRLASAVGAADKKANDFAQNFSRNLIFLRSERDNRAKQLSGLETLHVAMAGATVSGIYETIRNASENTEESLLLRHSVRRFLRRLFLVNNFTNPAENLITDLTLAGYLKNDTVPLAVLQEIDQTIAEFTNMRNRLLKKFPRETADRWTIDPLSSQIEQILYIGDDSMALIDLAKDYFASSINTERLLHITHPKNYDVMLFISVSRVLMKHEEATIRMNLLKRYDISRKPNSSAVNFAKFNFQLDKIFESNNLKQISQVVDRNGAPFRIMWKTALSDKKLAEHVLEEKTFIGPFDAAVGAEYIAVHNNINRGIIRSVIFLIITKFLIGIALEVPYDLWVHGEIIWEALIINLFLPPIYMIALRFTLAMPSMRNRRALSREISRILYSPVPTKKFIGATASRKFSFTYNLLFGIFVAGIFTASSWLLITFAKFEWAHLLIFFFFISTASFLGFRISRQIREIEVGSENLTTASLLRDLIYMPFVSVGKRISEGYSKFNIISQVLDLFVELPLKTILEFSRKWGSFLSAKRDEF